jgi:hypothetical protein
MFTKRASCWRRQRQIPRKVDGPVRQKQTYTFGQRVGHLVSWFVLLAVPVCALLSVIGWLPQPFGDLGTLSDVSLIILAAVFVHGIVQVANEAAE